MTLLVKDDGRHAFSKPERNHFTKTDQEERTNTFKLQQINVVDKYYINIIKKPNVWKKVTLPYRRLFIVVLFELMWPNKIKPHLTACKTYLCDNALFLLCNFVPFDFNFQDGDVAQENCCYVRL